MTGCEHNWFLKDVGKSSHRKSSEARVLLHAVTCFQFQLMYWKISKHSWSNMFMGVRSWVVQEQWQHNEKRKKNNSQGLMSDEDTLNRICLRANYLAYSQNNFSSAAIPLQLGMVGEMSTNKKCFTCIASWFTMKELWRQPWCDNFVDCSETDSTESENDNQLFLNDVQTFILAYFIA